jgi:flagellar hook-associated protein 3 FlgL
MLISTAQSYDNARDRLSKNLQKVNQSLDQQSAKQRVLKPSDNALASARSVTLGQGAVMNETFKENRYVAMSNLTVEVGVLTSTVAVFHSLAEKIVNAGNQTHNDTDRATVAVELRGLRAELLGYANTKDSNGNYLFSGYDGDVTPFDDQGNYTIPAEKAKQRLVQVEAGRQIASGDLGSTIFTRGNPGSLGYIASGSSTTVNTGTAVFGATSFDPAGANAGSDFEITFSVNATGELQYRAVATSADPAVAPKTIGPHPYKAGETLTLDGAIVAVSGVPNAGDAFSVKTNQSADANVFRVMDKFIAAMEAPVQKDSAARARQENDLATVSRTLQLVMDNVSTVQASVGARMVGLAALDASGAARGIDYAKQITENVGATDLDFIAITSELALRQTTLEASARAFKIIQNLDSYTQS